VPPEVVQHTLVLEYNNVQQLEEAFALHGKDIACLMIEPIAGNMNFVRASVSSRAAAASCARNTARCWSTTRS
jgi:glutamate-1-semialdehyde 2,1-aminomutase